MLALSHYVWLALSQYFWLALCHYVWLAMSHDIWSTLSHRPENRVSPFSLLSDTGNHQPGPIPAVQHSEKNKIYSCLF